MSKKNSGLKKFMLGAAVGVGLGFLFAPKEGSETRKELKEKLNELVDSAKKLNKEDVVKAVEIKVKDIKQAIDDLDSETVIKSAHQKAKKLKKMVEELAKYAADKSAPALDKTINAIQKKTDKVIDGVLDKLENK